MTTDQPDGSTWHVVGTAGDIRHPIVVMGPPTLNGWQPTTVRVRDVTRYGFQFQFDEWDYLNGSHVAEDVSYGVFEAGVGTIDAAETATAEAGSVGGVDEHWVQVPFDFAADFGTTPVVIAQVASREGSNAVTVRIRNVTTEGFEVRLQEQEAFGTHVPERVHYIAAEPADTSNLTVDTTGDVVTHSQTSVSLSGFSSTPHVLAQIQTFDGPDPCNLRVKNVSSSNFDVKVDEETSADDETSHTTENVGYIAFE